MSTSKTLLAFIGGAAAGAALVLLFNTEKGKEIRDNLSDKVKDAADKILEKTEEIINEAEASAKKS